MGVIRWRKVFGADFGEVGGGSICRVIDVLTNWRLELWPSFQGVRAASLMTDDTDLRFNSKMLAKEYAEQMLQEWLDAAGLIPKPSFAEPRPPLIWTRKQIGNRMSSAGYLGKTEACHVFDPGYHGVKCWMYKYFRRSRAGR